ncbi:MAG: cytochrome c, partial [Chloroflexota bacterium]
MSYRLAYGYRILIITVLSMVMVACSDLAGEPEIVATVPSASNTVADVELPPSAPDIANGARIYQQSCTSCHGEMGAGDGELVESGDVPRMGSFLDPVHMRQQSPAFYYDIITNGNIINLMPPWSGSLSVQERWDVAMYTARCKHTLPHPSVLVRIV